MAPTPRQPCEAAVFGKGFWGLRGSGSACFAARILGNNIRTNGGTNKLKNEQTNKWTYKQTKQSNSHFLENQLRLRWHWAAIIVMREPAEITLIRVKDFPYRIWQQNKLHASVSLVTLKYLLCKSLKEMQVFPDEVEHNSGLRRFLKSGR